MPTGSGKWHTIKISNVVLTLDINVTTETKKWLVTLVKKQLVITHDNGRKEILKSFVSIGEVVLREKLQNTVKKYDAGLESEAMSMRNILLNK